MSIVYTLSLTFLVILNSIEFSSPFDCLPNGDPITDVPYDQTANFAARQLPPARQYSPARCQSQAEPALQARSRSPQARSGSPLARSGSPQANARCMVPPSTIVAPTGSVYRLDHLHSIRLIPFKNPELLFELRKYTFPAEYPIKLRVSRKVFVPMPTQEQIVLSTSNGDVFAILETSKLLAGIYAYDSQTRNKSRAKINMRSGMITLLDSDEINATPVGRRRRIPFNFQVNRVNDNPPHH